MAAAGTNVMKVLITDAMSDAGIVVAQSLGCAGFEIVGVDRRSPPRWLRTRWLRELVAIPQADPQHWQDNVLGAIRRFGVELFLPLCSRGVQLAVERRQELGPRCNVLAPDREAFMNAYDKRCCMAICRELGIPSAGFLTEAQARELLLSGERVVVKPGHDRGGAKGVSLVEHAGDLSRAIAAAEAPEADCLIQAFIPGNAAAMRSITVVMDGAGNLLASFQLQKLRHVPATGGITALAKSCHDPALLASVLPFFRHCGWRGPAEVECKWDASSGCFRVIEINPRFPGTLRLSVLCGLDLPLLVAQATIRSPISAQPQPPAYPEGKRYVAPTLFARSVLNDAEHRGWPRALVTAWADMAGSAGMLRSLLAEPLPVLARTFYP